MSFLSLAALFRYSFVCYSSADNYEGGVRMNRVAFGMGSEDDVERKAVAHQKNVNRKVDVDAGCL